MFWVKRHACLESRSLEMLRTQMTFILLIDFMVEVGVGTQWNITE